MLKPRRLDCWVGKVQAGDVRRARLVRTSTTPSPRRRPRRHPHRHPNSQRHSPILQSAKFALWAALSAGCLLRGLPCLPVVCSVGCPVCRLFVRFWGGCTCCNHALSA
eukprot:366442-Chlamydomonas_euryale.AAC.7